MPRFIGCFDSTPCVADEVSYFTEGDDVRFNISVGYIPGGPSGMQQSIRLVRLEADSILMKCLNNALGSCLVNPTLLPELRERLIFSRNESDPWFDIEINITNAVIDDSGVYRMILEAQDLSDIPIVTQSISTVTVSVTPTPSLSVTPTSSKQISTKTMT